MSDLIVLVDLEDAAIIRRDQNGGLHVTTPAHHAVTWGTRSGRFWDVLIGLIFLWPRQGRAVVHHLARAAACQGARGLPALRRAGQGLDQGRACSRCLTDRPAGRRHRD